MKKEKKKHSGGAKRFWLSVGIIALIIGIVIEVWLENYSSLALIIPILYLNNVRKTL